MLRLLGGQRHRGIGAGLGRRAFLRVGAAGLIGLGLPDLLRAAAASRPRAKSLIFFALEGGPSHIDLWDMKPDAPESIRGEFRPIDTTVPGLHFCEHLPLLANQAHHLALIRSVHHTVGDHNAGYYYAATGRDPSAGGRLITAPSRANFPPIPARARQAPTDRPAVARVGATSRLDEQQWIIPPGARRRVPRRRVRPVGRGRPEPPRLRSSRPDPPAQRPARSGPGAAARSWNWSTTRSAKAEVVEGLGSPLSEGVRSGRQPRGAPGVRPRAGEPLSVRERYGLDLDNPPDQGGPASSAASRTWGSASCSPAA